MSRGMRQDNGGGRGITQVAQPSKAPAAGGVETWGYPQAGLALVLTQGAAGPGKRVSMKRKRNSQGVKRIAEVP